MLRLNQGGAMAADYSGVPATMRLRSTAEIRRRRSTSRQLPTPTTTTAKACRVSFGNLPDLVSAGTHSGTTVSITDDDVPSVRVRFEQASYSVAEGNSVPVKVVLSADPERTVTIPVTDAGQGGASSSDYSVPTSVVFNSGDTEKTLSFSATQDSVDDDGESVKLGFGSTPCRRA